MSNDSTVLNWPRDNFSNIEEAFEGDLWKRKKLADQLENYIKRLKIGATLALDGEWGAGKSWFIHHFKKQLTNNDHEVIYLDAFIHDYIEDPFLILASEISNKIENKHEGAGIALRKIAVSAYHALLPNLPMLLVHLTLALSGADIFAKEVSDSIKNIKDNSGNFGEKCAEVVGEQVKEHLEEKVKNYESEKQSLEYFKSELESVTSRLERPLVFIIDELDRCKPEFSIRLIERIKHFFDTPNIVFILVMHKTQLTESINSYYGFTSNNLYLEKFIDFTVQLNAEHHLGSIEYKYIIYDYFDALGIGEGSQREGINEFIKESVWLAKTLKILPRQLKRVFNKFSLLKNPNSPLDINGGNITLLFLFLDEIGFTSTNDGDVFEFIINKFVGGNKLKETLLNNVLEHLDVPTYASNEQTFFKLVSNEISYAFAHFFKQYFLVKFEMQQMTWERMLRSSDYRPPNNQQNGSFEKAWFDYIHQGI